MKELVTIIVPVYNVEKYLDKCIKSIINQDYTNLEIILVNDGSTDLSEKICLKYKENDKRIKLISKTNGGLSSARNVGLQYANGKYISFIDSDDFIHPSFISIMMENMLADNSDIVRCNFYHFSDDSDIYDNVNMNYDKKCITVEEAYKSILSFPNKKYDNYFVNKIYKKEILKDIYFPEGKCFEDLGTMYKVLDNVKYITLIDISLYYYYHRPDSITGKMSIKSIEDKNKLVFERHKYIEAKHPKFIKLENKYILLNSIYEGKELVFKLGKEVQNNQLFNSIRKEIKKRMKLLIILNPKYCLFGLIILLNNGKLFDKLKRKKA